MTATDISQVALDHAAARATRQGVSVEWVCGAFEDTSFEPLAFDLVITRIPHFGMALTASSSSL